MRRGRLLKLVMLLLRRGGSVLDWRRAVEQRRRRNLRREWEERDGGRRRDNWEDWDDSDGDLRGWGRGGRRGVRLLAVSVIAPSNMVGSDWLRQRGHKFHAPRLGLPVDELLLFALLLFCMEAGKEDVQLSGQ